MRIGTRRHLLAMVCLFAAACDQETSVVGPESAGNAESAPAAISTNSRADLVRPAEARLRALARQFPGFGGYSFDREGNLHVIVTDAADSRATQSIVAALQPAIRERRSGRAAENRPDPQVVVERGEYTFLQLEGWRDRTTDALLQAEGVSFVDLSEDKNRLTIGVEPSRAAQGRAAAEQILTRVGVPLGAAVFEARGLPITHDAPDPRAFSAGPSGASQKVATTQAACATLTDACRPMLAGTQVGVVVDWFGRTACTLGPTVYYQKYMAGFLTAAHCSDRIGHTNTSEWYEQPNYSQTMGYEYMDPGFATYPFSTSYGTCSDTLKCRRSDMLLGRAHHEIGLGYIARTNGYGSTGRGMEGGKSIVGTWTIVGELGGSPQINSYVEKVGWKTGWTYGRASQTCVDIKYARVNTSDPNHNVVFRCQHFVDDAYAAGGDSGAPVFSLYDGLSGSRVTLHGIVWGADTDLGGFYYSSLDMIRIDLGIHYNDTFGDLRTY